MKNYVEVYEKDGGKVLLRSEPETERMASLMYGVAVALIAGANDHGLGVRIVRETECFPVEE